MHEVLHRHALQASQTIRVLELRCADGPGGGPEKTILNGAAAADSNILVTVCYIREQGDPDDTIRSRAQALGVSYHEVRQRNALDHAIWSPIKRLALKAGIDVVHSHDYKTDLLALLLARRVGTIPLATAHGWTGASRRERLIYYPADKRLLKRFPLVLAVSSQIRDELIRNGAKPERVRVLLNGIDHRRFRRDPSRVPAARAAFGVREDAVVIGSVGRLEPQKRFDLLIDAFDQIRASHPKVVLLVAGEGSQRVALEAEIARRGLQKSCRLLGHVENVVDFYHALDLFAQSSDYEGTPNVVLEAMAFEVPIVATSAGGTAELIENGIHGRVVPTGDPAGLAGAVADALGNPASTRARTAAARMRVENELSFEQRCRTLDRVYQSLRRNRIMKGSDEGVCQHT